jgi:YtoQ family protein
MLNVYLSGEIHSNWREEIIDLCKQEKLNISFSSPITDHEASDNCGVEILGNEEKNFWKDNKGAKINSIKTRKSIKDCDVVIVKFGEKYKQWNAAFDAGYSAALNKSIIVIHNEEHQHALKEVDAAAAAVAKDQHQVMRILKYILEGSLD